jgi:hypothetical protein
MDYVQQFEFVLRYKLGTKNKVVDALSRRPHLLHMFSANVVGFDSLKTQYANDEDFDNVWNDISTHGSTSGNEYLLCDGFLFYKSCLCVPDGSF